MLNPKQMYRQSPVTFAAQTAIALYVLIQNFLKWIPFAPGSLAANLPNLKDNVVSVIASLSLFAFLISVLSRTVLREFKFRLTDKFLFVFLVYLLIQVLFRENKTEEFVRSLALIMSLVSSVVVGKFFSANENRLHPFFETLKWTMVVSIGLGAAVAILKPDSVDWGTFAGAQCLGKMFCRTEFFFFAINPLIAIVLLLRSRRANSKYVLLYVALSLLIFSLVLMTRTRQFTLTTILSSMFMFAIWVRSRRRVLVGLGTIVIVSAALFGPQIFKFFVEYTRITPEPSAVAVDARAADWTSGRIQLLNLIWDVFKANPIFGVGGVEIRSLIAKANFNARTEHGFSFYLATYGVFGIPFLLYLFAAFARGVQTLWNVFRNRIVPNDPKVTLALIVVPLFPFGFVGLFGSATNPTDWFALALAGLILNSETSSQAPRERHVETS